MDQKERLEELFQCLCAEHPQYFRWKVSEEEKRKAVRALMNLRMPGQITKSFLTVQDAFLQQEAREKGIVEVSELSTIQETMQANWKNADKTVLWRGDITRLRVDAIVNAANSEMLGCFVPCHGCIDNAIHSAAGLELRECCAHYMKRQRNKYGKDYKEPTGRAVITPAYNLPSKYVIHTVGPIVQGKVTALDRMQLKSCYQSCLMLAEKMELESIAFCCISTGAFRFPKQEAAEIAINTVYSFLNEHQMLKKIIWNVFQEEDFQIYQSILQQKKS